MVAESNPADVRPGSSDETSGALADPLKRLLSFHGELRRALKQLATLAERDGGEVSADDVRPLVALLRGPLTWHDIDEETLLIPLVLERLGSVDADPGLSRAQRDHQELEGLVGALLEHLDDIVAGERSCRVLLTTASHDLTQLLIPHLDLEEQVVFPVARRLLTGADLAQMSTALEERAKLRRATAARAEASSLKGAA